MPEPTVTCADCKACCCRLEAMLFDDPDIPEEFVVTGKDGRRSMAAGEDGLCVALDRATMRCTIYDKRPLVCRVFEMGGTECIAQRKACL